MFDTIDERTQQDDPQSWKDMAGKALVAILVVALLAGGIYLSVVGNG
jgi:hypothetical protein